MGDLRQSYLSVIVDFMTIYFRKMTWFHPYIAYKLNVQKPVIGEIFFQAFYFIYY